ncbi:MAG: Gfo/Idh/MocA family oxidoreductase [Bdellovibrionota bacterium]|nr:Gfo/Idh/MocA family oxidoreductase [Bdellovibrionota bacterium]
MKKLRTAVVGVGYLGRFHAQKHAASEYSELVAVVDSNEARAKEIAEELGCGWFRDASELIGKVDAVSIAAVTQMHYELAKLFLENNIHVLVEKPITAASSQGQELCELAKKNSLKLQVGHIERFNPALQSVKEKLRAKPLFIEVHRLAPFKPRATDVDVVLDLMIHDIDVILSLVDSPVKEVKAVGVPVLTKAVDIANARLEFESGTICNLTASRVSQSAQRKFRVFQEAQYLSIDFGNGEVGLSTKKEPENEGSLAIDHETWNLEKEDALFLETESFFKAILQDVDVEVSGEDGLEALALAEKISQLARESSAK